MPPPLPPAGDAGSLVDSIKELGLGEKEVEELADLDESKN
jgi:hypothetical protein